VQNSSDLERRLRNHVERIGGEIGERHVWRPRALNAAADYIAAHLSESGYRVNTQWYQAASLDVRNVVADLNQPANTDEIVVIGAHYDSIPGCPGANDNGSGVAALLEVARACAQLAPTAARNLRFVAFVNEEPPFFQTNEMGSLVFARAARERNEKIVAMLSLETIGYYSRDPGSQQYPVAPLVIAPFVISARNGKLRRGRLSREGDFIAFVGNTASAALLRTCLRAYARYSPSGVGEAGVPAVGAAAPAWIPGVGWSDHWAFWQCGYPALMVTDTAPFRYPDYHLASDTPDKLEYSRLTDVVRGLIATVLELGRVRL
jgi:Zn-dependent M28 family amino/carboxypeptidase